MMTKLLSTFTIAFVIGFSFAQDLSIVSVDDMGTSLNGTEQEVNGNPSDIAIYKSMRVVNNSTESVTIRLRRNTLANNGVLDQICYDDVLCVDADEEPFIIPSDITIEPGEDAEFKPQIVPDGNEVCVINHYEVISPFGTVYEEITVKFTSGSADCFLSTEQQPLIESFEFYPNPANENITVTFNSNEKAKLQVVDALGKKVMDKNIKSGATISLNSLNNGVYFVQLLSSDGLIERKKLIVKR